MESCPMLTRRYDRDWCKAYDVSCGEVFACKINRLCYNFGVADGMKGANQQIMWERDTAIQQLKDHHILFGCIQKPLTLDEAFDRSQAVGCVWGEVALKEEADGFFPCFLQESRENTERMEVLLMGCDDVLSHWKDIYGKTFRCWAVPPTVEDMEKNEWEKV